MLFPISNFLYALAAGGLALFGFNALVLTWRYYATHAQIVAPPALEHWPTVTVQLPVFNERAVVERVIDAAAGLHYAAGRLSIQVLDDSTDDTSSLARARVAHHRAHGVDIVHHHRAQRPGHKAAALAEGLQLTDAEFVAVFDADFVPAQDFLQRVIPHFFDAQVAAVQTRWAHLNAEQSWLTRAQALALDGHFVVEQAARSRSALFFNFNGSGGVWRSAAIADAGGWQADTIAEDLDLSYRAQLRGWQLRYLPQVECGAEVPYSLAGFKRQQFRWAKGSVQCLRKHTRAVVADGGSLWRKLQAGLHLAGYLSHPLLLVLLLASLPLALAGGYSGIALGVLGVAGFGPPVLCAAAQRALSARPWRRLAIFPALLLLQVGMQANNTRGVLEGLLGRNPRMFLRTPKSGAVGRQFSGGTPYALPLDWTTWAEIGLGAYALFAAAVAAQRAPGMLPFLLLLASGNLYTAACGLAEAWRQHRAASPPRSARWAGISAPDGTQP